MSVLSCLGTPDRIPRVVPIGGNLQKVFKKREIPDSENLSAKSFVFLMLPQRLELNFKNGIFLECALGFRSYCNARGVSLKTWSKNGEIE